MAANYSVKDATGTTITKSSTDVGAGVQADNVRPTDGTNFANTGDVAARRNYVQHCDGTNATPALDAVSRKGFFALTDGTDTLAIEAANAALSELVATCARAVAHLFALDSAAGAGSQQVPLQVESTAQPNLRIGLFAGANQQAVKAASTAALAADKAAVVAVSPNNTVGISPPGVTGSPQAPLEVCSTNAAATNNQTLAAAASKFTYISGFDFSGLGATAGSTIAITITGLTNTLTFYYTVPAGATVAAPVLSVRFNPPLQGSAANTAVVVNVPSFGVGNLTASACAYGFQQ